MRQKTAKEVSTDSKGENRPVQGRCPPTLRRSRLPTRAPGSPDGPAPPPPPGRAPSASACEPYRELIEDALGRRRNAMAIYQDLVSFHGFTAKYASVRRFVRKLGGHNAPEARAVIQTAPGEEAQVDYGDGPMVRDPQSGKYRRVRLFVLTLGYSRKSVRLLTFRSSTRIWAELHQESFRRLGGSVRVVVLDNLLEGVLKPDIYDPTLNPLMNPSCSKLIFSQLRCPGLVGHCAFGAPHMNSSSSTMMMAPFGQIWAQRPQPLQYRRSITVCCLPASFVIAWSGQISMHASHPWH